MEQRSLEDVARDQRDAGIEQAAQNDRIDGASLQATLADLIKTYLERHPSFFIDDFWEWAETQESWAKIGIDPGRYVGAAMQKAQNEGWMRKLDVWAELGIPGAPAFAARASVRSNLSPKWVYASRLYRKDMT